MTKSIMISISAVLCVALMSSAAAQANENGTLYAPWSYGKAPSTAATVETATDLTWTSSNNAVVSTGYAGGALQSHAVHAIPSRLIAAPESDPLETIRPTGPHPTPDAYVGVVGANEIIESSGVIEGDVSFTTPSYGGPWYEQGGCAGCGSCGDVGCNGAECGQFGCDYYGQCCKPLWLEIREAWRRHGLHRFFINTTLFAGVEGFKGPVDMGVNGNFGFHDGVSFAGPLDPGLGIGFQAGVAGTHTDISGNDVGFNRQTKERDQVFWTLGLFRRDLCRGGLQWAVVYDGLHDEFYSDFDLGQIRTEISWLGPYRGEIGFLGAFHATSDDIRLQTGAMTWTDMEVESYDYYTAFYRRNLCNGGQWRVFLGGTNQSNAMLGADCRLPMSDCWALSNSFTYIVPSEGRRGGPDNESWNVMISLVWSPGRQAASWSSNNFMPTLGVADNGTLLSRVR